MLVLTRKIHERIVMGGKDGTSYIEVLEISGSRVRLGIEAPQSVKIDREEVYIEEQRKQHAQEIGGRLTHKQP